MTSSAAPRRRLIFQLIWLFVALVIAASVLKLAFFSSSSADSAEPTGVLEAPVIAVERSSIANTFVVPGSVSADSGVPVRATEQGTITEVYAANGAKVSKGDTLFELREQTGETEPRILTEGDPEEGVEPTYADPEPIYAYYTVTAPATGTLSGFTPLPKMSVSIGEELGQIGPGTFTVVADLTAAMQYRMLDQSASATVTISGGPAPFECSSLEIGAPVEQDAPEPVVIDPYGYDPYLEEQSSGTSNVTGQIRCAVPASESVFAGLSAEIEVTAGVAEDVLVLPVTAVRGDYATGIVYLAGDSMSAGAMSDGVVPEGEMPEGAMPEDAFPEDAMPEDEFGSGMTGDAIEVNVELGLTDGVYVEIVSGLEESQLVLEYVPSEVPMYDEYGMYDEVY